MVDCRFEPEIFNMSLEHLKLLGNKENIKQKGKCAHEEICAQILVAVSFRTPKQKQHKC